MFAVFFADLSMYRDIYTHNFNITKECVIIAKTKCMTFLLKNVYNLIKCTV